MADHKVNIVLAAQDKASAVVRSLRTQFASFGKDVKQGFGIGAGMNVFSLAQQGITQVVDVMGDAVNMASDLAEQQGKVDIVFGESADEVHAWAKGAVDDFGMTERAAETAAGTLGNLLTTAGVTGDELKQMSMDVVELGADLGAFNNVPTEEALLAIQSGLNGEAEPLRRFGVLLNEARVQAKGMAMGLADANGKLTDQAKVQARYALIVEDTATAHGNFDATASGAAAQTKILNARMEQLQTDMGTFLVGPAKDFVGFLNDVIKGGADAGSSIDTFIKSQRELAASSAAANKEGEEGLDILDLFFKSVQATTDILRPQDLEARQFAESIAELGRSADQSQEGIQNLFLYLKDEAGLSVEEAKRRIIEFLTAIKNSSAFILTEGARTGKALGNLAGRAAEVAATEKKAAAEARELAAALGFVADNTDHADDEAKELEQTWKRLMKQGDGNKRSIRELTRDINRWDREMARALREGDSERFIFAQHRRDEAFAERRLRRVALRDFEEERKAQRRRARIAKETADKTAEAQRLVNEARRRGNRLERLAEERARKHREAVADLYRELHKLDTMPNPRITISLRVAQEIPFLGGLISRFGGGGGGGGGGGNGGRGGNNNLGTNGLQVVMDGEILGRLMDRRSGRQEMLYP